MHRGKICFCFIVVIIFDIVLLSQRLRHVWAAEPIKCLFWFWEYGFLLHGT
jgi:hypothetical protein